MTKWLLNNSRVYTNGKRKRITAVTIEALKDKVLKKGLEWKQLMEAIE